MSRVQGSLAAVLGLGLLVGMGALFRRTPSGEPVRPEFRRGSDPERAPARPAEEPGSGSRSSLPADPVKPSFRQKVSASQALRGGEEAFWNDLAAILELRRTLEPATYQEKLAEITKDYLGLDPSQAAAFRTTAAATTAEIRQAWATRDQAILALPAWLPEGERSKKEQSIQERYQEAKRQALTRVEALLGDVPRHQRFRSKLDEWIDAAR